MSAIIGEVDLDGNRSIEAIELAQLTALLRKAALRARQEAARREAAAGVGMREDEASAAKAELERGGAGGYDLVRELLGEGAPGADGQRGQGGPLLLGAILAHSRAPRQRQPRLFALERERLIYQTRHQAPKTLRPPAVARVVPDTVAHPPPPLGPLGSDWEMSALGRQFAGMGPEGHASYLALLLLSAFFEPATKGGGLDGVGGGGGPAAGPVPVVELRLAQALYVWAHLVANGPGAAGQPMLEPASWHACLQRWLRTVARTRLVSFGGRSVLYGVQLSHPSRRSHQLQPWDTAHLLAFFGVARSDDVPKPRPRALDTIPIGSLWGLVAPEGGGGGGGGGANSSGGAAVGDDMCGG